MFWIFPLLDQLQRYASSNLHDMKCYNQKSTKNPRFECKHLKTKLKEQDVDCLLKLSIHSLSLLSTNRKGEGGRGEESKENSKPAPILLQCFYCACRVFCLYLHRMEEKSLVQVIKPLPHNQLHCRNSLITDNVWIQPEH